MKNVEELLDTLHMEDLRNEKHPSMFDENEEYDMLIVRIPVIEDVLNVKSTGFVITKQNSYLYNKEKQIFEELGSRFEGPHKIIDKMTDKLLKSFAKYQDTVSDMEDKLYANSINRNFLNNWLELKLDIVRIERVLLKAVNTLDEFIYFYKDTEGFPINNYVDLHEHLDRTTRSAALQLSKLDYLYSFYNAKSNDKMNRMIYVLTIISSIFLPLNLVVGFFGMNTSGLPFAGGEVGTYYAISLMAALVVVTSLIVKVWQKKAEN